MKKRQILILLFIEIQLVLLTGCGEHAESPVKEEAGEEVQSEVIQISPKAVHQSGITTVVVDTRSVSNEILTTGEIKASENRVFQIGSFAPGRVIRDNVILGDYVQRGQTLAVVQNTEVAKIQADYIHELHQNEIDVQQAKTRLALAQKTLEREQRLLAEGISPRKDYLQAQTDTALAQSELQGQQEHRVHIQAEGKALLGAYGMNPGRVHSETIQTGTPVIAPKAGVITRKNITLGAMVTPETPMYEVADLSQVWLDVTVYPKDLPALHTGQLIRFTSDSLPGQVFSGQINYIPPTANEASHTFVARAFLENPEGLLKPGTFGQIAIQLPEQQNKPFVPEEAVQKYGRETFVFKVLGSGKYQKQTVQLAGPVTGGYLVNAGIQPGDRIVSKGSFTLKAEMLKSQFAEEEEE